MTAVLPEFDRMRLAALPPPPAPPENPQVDVLRLDRPVWPGSATRCGCSRRGLGSTSCSSALSIEEQAGPELPGGGRATLAAPRVRGATPAHHGEQRRWTLVRITAAGPCSVASGRTNVRASPPKSGSTLCS